MKNIILSFVAWIALAATAQADIIAQWNFNNTNVASASSPAPTAGAGRAALVGGATATYAAGSTADSEAINRGWNTATYPAQGTSNKTRGVQFTVDTTGYESIGLSWQQRITSTASRYARVQYSTDGLDFVDSGIISLSDVDDFVMQTNTFTGLGVVENSPNLIIRILTEWESTAAGTTNNNYVTASASTYAPGGTLRFDLFTVHGSPATGNMPPSIASIGNQIIRMNGETPTIPFTISDAETAADNLLLTQTSSDRALIPEGNITFGGTGSNRTLQVTPALDLTGTATITVTVTDEGGRAASTQFTVTVLPENTVPTISSISPTNTALGALVGPIPFVIGDLESPSEDLELSGSSSDLDLLPNENIVFGGTGSNRTVTITPTADKSGVAVIKITVGDISLSTNTTFAVMVLPSEVLFCDGFTYADGPIIRVSGGLWRNHSGTMGQMINGGGRLSVLATQAEDASASLRESYTTNSGAKLYAKFTLNVSTLPTSEYGNYFAHFKDNTATGFTTRILTQTHDAAPGAFRLAILNRTSNPTNATQLPVDLNPGTDYVVVSRYDTATGISTLWLNPASESDTSVSGGDGPIFLTISTYAFRESPDFGQVNIDDLKVATSFSALAGHPSLNIQCMNDTVTISWPGSATGFRLQASSMLGSAAAWEDVADVPAEVTGRKVVHFINPQEDRFFRLIQN